MCYFPVFAGTYHAREGGKWVSVSQSSCKVVPRGVDSNAYTLGVYTRGSQVYFRRLFIANRSFQRRSPKNYFRFSIQTYAQVGKEQQLF